MMDRAYEEGFDQSMMAYEVIAANILNLLDIDALPLTTQAEDKDFQEAMSAHTFCYQDGLSTTCKMMKPQPPH